MSHLALDFVVDGPDVRQVVIRHLGMKLDFLEAAQVAVLLPHLACVKIMLSLLLQVQVTQLQI